MLESSFWCHSFLIIVQVQRNYNARKCFVLNECVAALFSGARLSSARYDLIMQLFLDTYDTQTIILAIIIALIAGAIKGVVGFAMPTIMISGLASFMSPELALAGLILPTLVTNGMQALRQGVGAAWISIKKFRVFLVVGLVMLLLSAQLVRILPINWLFLGIGTPITIFTLSQIAGWRPATILRSARVEAAVGALAGFVGGLSGVWGPPTVAYLTAIDTPKREHLRIQGAIYGLGATALFFAHLQSGVIRAETLPLSLGLVVPAVVGLWLGFQVQDKINQDLFRKVTLWVLLLAGLNLIRRGLMG